MKLFKCQNCSQVVYFENTKCESCGHSLGYLPEAMTVTALEPDNDAFRALAAPKTSVQSTPYLSDVPLSGSNVETPWNLSILSATAGPYPWPLLVTT